MRLALALGDENAVSMPIAAAANEVKKSETPALPISLSSTASHSSFCALITDVTQFEMSSKIRSRT
ncbi:unnamed protein product [Linum tenue]|nr:unnamed protein product [Linum tenue]